MSSGTGTIFSAWNTNRCSDGAATRWTFIWSMAVTLHSIRGLTPLIFQHCPLFHCRFIALKSGTFVVKSQTTFAIKFVRDLNAKSTPMGDCCEAAWGVALHRESVIRRLAEHPRLSSESIAEAANQLGLSRSILYKLLQRYRRRPQTSSLLPWKRGRKPDESL